MKNIAYHYSSYSLICKDGQYGCNSLFIGDAEAAKNKNWISQNKINTIISIGLEAEPKIKIKDVVYHKIALRDQKTENISQYFQEVIQLILKGRQHGNVLIHCFHGSSRSASFLIAYLMAVGKLTYENALSYAKNKRNSISPN